MVEVMKKSVAVGIAGLAALVVSAWRQIQRDNSLDNGAGAPGTAAPKPASGPATEQKPKPAEPAARPGAALFTPSVSENSTKSELYEVATELEVEGRSKMNKAELLKAIRAAS